MPTITNAGVLTISANAVALTTDTTGNYVASIASGNGISGSSASEGGTPTIAIDLLDSADGTGSTSSNSGLEFQGSGSNELTVLQGCANNEVLSWNDSTKRLAVCQCVWCRWCHRLQHQRLRCLLERHQHPFRRSSAFCFPRRHRHRFLHHRRYPLREAALPRSQLWLTWLPQRPPFRRCRCRPCLGQGEPGHGCQRYPPGCQWRNGSDHLYRKRRALRQRHRRCPGHERWYEWPAPSRCFQRCPYFRYPEQRCHHHQCWCPHHQR